MPTLDPHNINLFVAFIAGIVTFFASCLLPLVPVYLAYLTGVSFTLDLREKRSKWLILRTSLLFVLGFITVFIVLGATFATLARTIAPYREIIERIGGILFILLGLYLSGVLESATLSKDVHFKLGKFVSEKRNLHALLTGMTFGFGWSPCVGPILGIILFWTSRQSTYLQGMMMLIAYGLGLGIPFIALGLGFEKLMPLLKRSQKYTHQLQKISGVIVVLAGALLLTGQVVNFTNWAIALFNLNGLTR